MSNPSSVAIEEQHGLELIPNGWVIPVLRQDVRRIILRADVDKSKDTSGNGVTCLVVRQRIVSAACVA